MVELSAVHRSPCSGLPAIGHTQTDSSMDYFNEEDWCISPNGCSSHPWQYEKGTQRRMGTHSLRVGKVNVKNRANAESMGNVDMAHGLCINSALVTADTCLTQEILISVPLD